MENYFAAKIRLFTELLANNGVAAINIDDAYGRKLIGKINGNTATFGTSPDAAYRISDISICPDGTVFKLSHAGTVLDITANLTGAYNIHNLAGVLTLLWATGFPPEILEKSAALPFQVPGRLEKVPTVSPAQFYVDFAHTDDALRNVLSTVKAFTSRKLWVVFGAGGDRDRTKRPRMGKAASEYADILVVTSDNPRSEPPEEIIDFILDRPFIFAIITESIPLFMGTVNTP
jgi:UDP-N-acetylmuramoyl-L-alanyl-D-glutamate--2,6-diaminopimelate ligase